MTKRKNDSPSTIIIKLIMNIVLRSFNNQMALLNTIRFYASKMQASSTKNKKDSAGKRLGIKKYGG